MKTKGYWASALGALVAVVLICPSKAGATPCGPAMTRAKVVPCALAASPVIRGDRHAIDAARGREIAAGVLIPSNPVLSISAAHRSAAPNARAINWYVTLAQEIEIAGQRGTRLSNARAETLAQQKRASVNEREVTAAALVAYFEAVAARDELALSERLASIGGGLAAAANARSEQGLLAPVESDVAYAASIRLVQAKAASERRVASTFATLASLTGVDPTKLVRVEGDLTPLAVTADDVSELVEKALSARAEIDVARAEGTAGERRVTMLRRANVPNVTLSAFAQNDGFNERVLGGGLSLPVPLLGPLGRMNTGEIAEAAALVRRAEVEVERLKRQVRLEVVIAARIFTSRKRELDAFDSKRLARAEESLRSLGQELAAGRLTVRDALLAQQSLVELLGAHVEAKRALCLASVELARAAGLPLVRGAL